MDTKTEILVILTGGTICSTENAEGKRFSDAKNIRIIEQFHLGESPYRDMMHFSAQMPLDILSENMTIKSWNILLKALRSNVDWKRYKGVIVLHGTDTLAYTSALLSILLAGAPIPVFMVSSQLPLTHVNTNGHANFRAAVELIMNGIAPNVYAVYRNSDRQIYVHYGAHLLQCANFSDDFFSADAMRIDTPENARLVGRKFQTDTWYLDKIAELAPCVMPIIPFVGIHYAAYRLDGIRAVVHGTFHSESVCVERNNMQGEYSDFSVLSLLDRCREANIPLFLAPCSPSAFQYESTGDALKHGACCIERTTFEMAYVKTLVGCALGYTGSDLTTFVNQPVNAETLG